MIQKFNNYFSNKFESINKDEERNFGFSNNKAQNRMELEYDSDYNLDVLEYFKKQSEFLFDI